MITIAIATVPVGSEPSRPEHLAWAISIAAALSVVLAAVEIASESKKPLRSCLVVQSLFYLCLLTIGNVVTTIVAIPLVTKLGPDFKPYYFFFAAFLGVFAFEAILKNMNITVLGQGVLTIQDWTKKALLAAAAAAIAQDTQRTYIENGKLASRLANLRETELNAFVLLKLSAGRPNVVRELDDSATANGADQRLYKAYAIATAVSHSEIESFLNGRYSRPANLSNT